MRHALLERPKGVLKGLGAHAYGNRNDRCTHPHVDAHGNRRTHTHAHAGAHRNRYAHANAHTHRNRHAHANAHADAHRDRDTHPARP